MTTINDSTKQTNRYRSYYTQRIENTHIHLIASRWTINTKKTIGITRTRTKTMNVTRRTPCQTTQPLPLPLLPLTRLVLPVSVSVSVSVWVCMPLKVESQHMLYSLHPLKELTMYPPRRRRIHWETWPMTRRRPPRNGVSLLLANNAHRIHKLFFVQKPH